MGALLRPPPGMTDRPLAPRLIRAPKRRAYIVLHGAAGSVPGQRSTHREIVMLHYAVVFFIIALIAALFGFGGIAAGAAGIAKILFIVFAVLAVASFLFGLTKKN